MSKSIPTPSTSMATAPLSSSNRSLRLEWWDASKLTPNPANWRRHNKAQTAALKGILREVGWAGALLYNEQTDHLIDGHLRREVSQTGQVPVLVGNWDEETERKILATYDPIGSMAQPDMDALLALLQQTEFESQAVNDMLEALANGETQPLPPLAEKEWEVINRLEELQAKWQVQTGDIWEAGAHRFMCGDAADYRRLLIDKQAQVLLSDPPYGIGIVRGKVEDNRQERVGSSRPHPYGRSRQPGGTGSIGGSNAAQPHVFPIIAGDQEPFDPSPWLDLAPVIILFGANHFASRLPDSPCWLVWDKGQGLESSFSDAELAWTNQDGHLRLYKHTWSGMVREGARDVELPTRLHPTQKPVGLLEQILQDFSKSGNLVFDPFLGSGSTAMACHRLGRICYGIEIDPQYIAVTLERLKNLGLEPKLLTKHPGNELAG